METLDLNCQEAVFPFFIWILLAIGAAIAGMLVTLINMPADYDIAILGNQGAGKTTLWNAITSNSDEAVQTIDREKIREIIIERGGVKRKIKQSYDISGGDDSVKDYYNDLCKNKTSIIYIYDCSRFEQNEEYQREVFMRLRKIGHETQKQSEQKYVHIIGSHIDKLTKDDTERKHIHAKQSKQILSDVNHAFNEALKKDENFILINLSSRDEVKAYIENKLFNN